MQPELKPGNIAGLYIPQNFCLADTLDEDQYPTDETLEVIAKWDVLHDADNFLQQLKSVWAYDSFVLSDTPPKEVEALLSMFDETKDLTDYRWLRLATAGWSGNESILQAMERNFSMQIHWYMSMCGGLVIYKLPEWLWKQQKNQSHNAS
jgi:hypothetical protein